MLNYKVLVYMIVIIVINHNHHKNLLTTMVINPIHLKIYLVQ